MTPGQLTESVASGCVQDEMTRKVIVIDNSVVVIDKRGNLFCIMVNHVPSGRLAKDEDLDR